jgi:hypothetical protein
LDAIDSTCLGLACKKLYKIHRSIHGTVSLWTGGYACHWYTGAPICGLGVTLKDWFPADLHYNWVLAKYVDEKGYKQFQKYLKEMRDRYRARKSRAKYRCYGGRGRRR